MRTALRRILLSCGLVSLAREVAAASPRQHIVLMVLDDVGRADTGVYSSNKIPTPNINSLAKQGVILDNYYTQPVCSPTRTSLLTGRYPFRVGMQHVTTQAPLMAVGVPYDTPFLSELMTNYERHHIGKHHLGYATWRHTPTGRGFRSHLGYLQGQIDYYDHTVGVNVGYVKVKGLDLWDGKRLLREARGNFTLDLYQTRLKKIVNEYIETQDTDEKRAAKPLFLYYAHQLAHIPLQSRRDEKQRCSKEKTRYRRAYCSMMVELDDAIGEFVTIFKQANLWDNTIVFVTTDNGGMTLWNKDEEGGPIFPASVGSNYPLRGSKATLFEGGVRSLAFVTGGAVPSQARGTKYKALAHAVDIAASILSIAGVLPRRREELKIDGFDLLPSMFYNAPPHRAHVPINIINKGRSYSAVRFGKYKVIVNDNLIVAAQGWFDENGALKQAAPADQHGKTLLFDLDSDPNERNDIANGNPDIVQHGIDLLQSYVRGRDYLEPQAQARLFLQGLPMLHEGAWKPFMSERQWRKFWAAELARQRGDGEPELLDEASHLVIDEGVPPSSTLLASA